jgi:hypothetical protein
VGVGLNVMEILRNMPNNEMLKELLEFSTVFTQMYREQGERRGASPFAEGLLPEDFLRVPKSRKGGQREVIEYAYNFQEEYCATSSNCNSKSFRSSPGI